MPNLYYVEMSQVLEVDEASGEVAVARGKNPHVVAESYEDALQKLQAFVEDGWHIDMIQCMTRPVAPEVFLVL